MMNVPVSLFEDSGTNIDANDRTIRSLRPGLNIHGFVINIHCLNDKYQLVVLETPDNQLDFNKLYLYDFLEEDKFSYKWE